MAPPAAGWLTPRDVRWRGPLRATAHPSDPAQVRHDERWYSDYTTGKKVRHMEQGSLFVDTGLHTSTLADFLGSVIQASTAYAIITTDLQGVILLWNEGARRLYGYTAQEVIGTSADLLQAPEDLALGLPAKMRAETLAQGHWEGIITQITKDQRHITARVVMTRRLDAPGAPADRAIPCAVPADRSGETSTSVGVLPSSLPRRGPQGPGGEDCVSRAQACPAAWEERAGRDAEGGCTVSEATAIHAGHAESSESPLTPESWPKPNTDTGGAWSGIARTLCCVVADPDASKRVSRMRETVKIRGCGMVGHTEGVSPRERARVFPGPESQ